MSKIDIVLNDKDLINELNSIQEQMYRLGKKDCLICLIPAIKSIPESSFNQVTVLGLLNSLIDALDSTKDKE